MPTLANNQPCPSCGRYGNRAVTVDGVIIENGEIWLIKRGAQPFEGYWALPGGHVDWDETTAEAARREVEEELRVKAVSAKFIGLYDKPERHPKQSINVAFVITIKGRPSPGDDAKECRRFPLGRLPKRMAFDHRRIIRDALAELERAK